MYVCLFLSLIASVWSDPTPACERGESEHDRLIGAVRTIVIETARLSEKSGRLKEGRRRRERVITYDRSGNLSKVVADVDSQSTSQITYRYDADGNRTDSSVSEGAPPDLRSGPGMYQRDERLTRVTWHMFKCDSNGNRLEDALYSHSNTAFQAGRYLLGVYQHTYDDRRNRQSTSYQSNGVTVYRLNFTYDGSRNATSMRRYSQDGSLVHEEKYTYELDSTGNWIKRLSSRSLKNESKFEAREVTYRKITYF